MSSEPQVPAGAPRPETHQLRAPVKLAGIPENLTLDHLLGHLVEVEGSDLHVTVDEPVKNRIHGRLIPLEIQGMHLQGSSEQIRRLLTAVLTEDQLSKLEETWELDFAYQPAGSPSRFRCNYFFADRSLRAVFRQIPTKIKTLGELGMPDIMKQLCRYPRGLVLVTGPTGSGKSTTLAAMIDDINSNREEHILTIEDPVEFVHRSKKATISQREVSQDTHSFANALKASLREDPDIILVGEMRDPETIALGITAAETGHLVFATLHTQDASQTVDRLIDSFPHEQQNQIKTQLSLTLQAVISQQLLPKVGGKGRQVALEIMTTTSAVRNALREGKTHQLYSEIQTGKQLGMQTMEQALAALTVQNVISAEVAAQRCSDPIAFQQARQGLMTDGMHTGGLG